MFSPEISWMLTVWVPVTAIFVGLMIWRSLLSMKEDDQLFLDPAESKLEAEQRDVIARLTRITPFAKGFGFASAGLLVLMAGLLMYHGIVNFSGAP